MRGQGFDVVIRFAHRLPDSRLWHKRLATTVRVLVASPGYLKRHGYLRRLDNLQDHRCLAIGNSVVSRVVWRFCGDDGPVEVRIAPHFSANNDLALILAACMDDGFLYIPKLLVENELSLQRLQVIDLEDVSGEEVGVHALYPQSKPPSKVSVFVEFVGEPLSVLANNDRWAPLQSPDFARVAERGEE